MSTVYLEKNGGQFEYFICKLPGDDKTVFVGNDVIAREAFKNASGVECVSLEKCEAVEEYAFEDCGELKIVAWESKEENKEKSGSVLVGISFSNVKDLKIQSGAFKNCTKLHTVILPSVSGTLVIEKDAFEGCTNLRTIVFPSCTGKVEIRKEAFDDCFKDMLLFVASNNPSAEKYAKKHGFEVLNV